MKWRLLICLVVFVVLQFWIWDYTPFRSYPRPFVKANLKIGNQLEFEDKASLSRIEEFCRDFEGEVLLAYDKHTVTFFGHDSGNSDFFVIEVIDAPPGASEIVERVEISEDGQWMNVYYRRNNRKAFGWLILILLLIAAIGLFLPVLHGYLRKPC